MDSPCLQVALGTSDLQRSIDYYRALFGVEPIEPDDGSVCFRLVAPPTEFKLQAGTVTPGGAMNHLGLRLTTDAAVTAVQARLERAGIQTHVETGSVCGYARQNKVWSTAPDGHSWEVYTVQEDIDPADMSCSSGCGSNAAENVPWQATPTDREKFHFGLGVESLAKSVAFYRQLFGVEPAKNFPDYAKFELYNPPLMFSLGQHPAANGGALRYVTLRLSRADFLAMHQRVATLHPQSVSLATDADQVLEVIDLDGVTWRFIAADGVANADSARVVTLSFKQQQAIVWSHRLTEPFPSLIPHADCSVSEVRLSGTFNAREAVTGIAALLQEVRRILAPEGKVVVTGLVSDQPFLGEPRFPAPAAQIERVPEQTEIAVSFEQAGFGNARTEKLAPVHCLDGKGVELLSIIFVAHRDE